MALKERLTDDMKSALRNRETVRLGLVRMIRAQIKNREIAKGTNSWTRKRSRWSLP